jgi:hypothetical protein
MTLTSHLSTLHNNRSMAPAADNTKTGLPPIVAPLNFLQFLSNSLSPCITISPTAPLATAHMSSATTKNTFSAPGSKHETAKHWLQRCLRKQASRQKLGDAGNSGLLRRISIKRPRTAPSSGAPAGLTTVPATPSVTIDIEHPGPQSTGQPPARPPRPDSGVMRDVNAWLDGSTASPSRPLMAGVPYWRKATGANTRNTPGIQHALPIVRVTDGERPSTSQSQRVKSFRRRARKMHVQMPALSRNKSQRIAPRKQGGKGSSSMPILAIPYEQARQDTPPKFMTRSRSYLNLALAPTISLPSPNTQGRTANREFGPELSRFRYGSPESARTSEAEGSIERRMNAIFGRSARSADSTRPSTAAAPLSREDSMGDLSDAPTYFTGPPPPSYRSRAASVMTTSSFGCIDGMSVEQRQMSRQRAALQRGMKGKLKKFAQNFTT